MDTYTLQTHAFVHFRRTRGVSSPRTFSSARLRRAVAALAIRVNTAIASPVFSSANRSSGVREHRHGLARIGARVCSSPTTIRVNIADVGIVGVVVAELEEARLPAHCPAKRRGGDSAPATPTPTTISIPATVHLPRVRARPRGRTATPWRPRRGVNTLAPGGNERTAPSVASSGPGHRRRERRPRTAPVARPDVRVAKKSALVSTCIASVEAP